MGQSIKRARSAQGWTQQQVANFLGCSRRQVNRVEQGEAEFALSELELLAKAFLVPLTELTEIRGEQFAIDIVELLAKRYGLPTKLIAKMRKSEMTIGQLFDFGKEIGVPFDVLVKAVELGFDWENVEKTISSQKDVARQK